MGDPSLRALQLKQALAQGMLQNVGDTTPVASPWAALSHVISPLLGALTMRDVNKQYGTLENGQNTELGALANGTGDPIAAIAASHNPLIRAMLPDLIQKQLEQRLAPPPPLQWHAPTENAYDAKGNLVHQGTPEVKAPPVRNVQQGGVEITQEMQPDGTWKELGRGPKWDPTTPKTPPADKMNPLGIKTPWLHEDR